MQDSIPSSKVKVCLQQILHHICSNDNISEELVASIKNYKNGKIQEDKIITRSNIIQTLTYIMNEICMELLSVVDTARTDMLHKNMLPQLETKTFYKYYRDHIFKCMEDIEIVIPHEIKYYVMRAIQKKTTIKDYSDCSIICNEISTILTKILKDLTEKIYYTSVVQNTKTFSSTILLPILLSYQDINTVKNIFVQAKLRSQIKTKKHIKTNESIKTSEPDVIIVTTLLQHSY